MPLRKPLSRGPLSGYQRGMEMFFACTPGHEPLLAAEARALDFQGVAEVPGGVTAQGDWAEVRRANVALRIAGRVLVRVAEFRAMHLAQLDKRARKVDWAAVLRPDVPIRVDATCRKSRIYHAGAAAQRVAKAITETLGAPVSDSAEIVVKLRIDDDLCTLSIDTTGEALHKRGAKQAVGKAPLRETLAAAFLRQIGFDGTQTLVDPMCGSGTLVLEAAEIAAGLWPGRARGFAMDRLAVSAPPPALSAPRDPGTRFYGSDRDQGAVAAALANAERAGVAPWCRFERCAISDRMAPPGPPGIVLTNPPWGTRIGARKPLFALYGSFGEVMRTRFQGWAIGLIAPDAGLVKATGLPFQPAGAPVDMGGIKVTLFVARL